VIWLFVLAVLAALPIIVVLTMQKRREAERAERSATIDLRVDEFGVWRDLADGRREGVDWGDINEVEVYRTTSGPHGSVGGMVLLCGDETHGCLVPLDLMATEGLVEGLTRLPGFDVRLLTEAMDATPPMQLTVWRRGS